MDIILISYLLFSFGVGLVSGFGVFYLLHLASRVEGLDLDPVDTESLTHE